MSNSCEYNTLCKQTKMLNSHTLPKFLNPLITHSFHDLSKPKKKKKKRFRKKPKPKPNGHVKPNFQLQIYICSSESTNSPCSH